MLFDLPCCRFCHLNIILFHRKWITCDTNLRMVHSCPPLCTVALCKRYGFSCIPVHIENRTTITSQAVGLSLQFSCFLFFFFWTSNESAWINLWRAGEGNLSWNVSLESSCGTGALSCADMISVVPCVICTESSTIETAAVKCRRSFFRNFH